MEVERNNGPLVKFCLVVGYPIRDERGKATMTEYGLRLVEYPSCLFPEVTIVAPGDKCVRSTENRKAISSLIPTAGVVLLPTPGFRIWRWLRQVPPIWR